MAQVRNTSDETLQDVLTGQVAEPDQVMTVPDQWVVHYTSPLWGVVSVSQSAPPTNLHDHPQPEAPAVMPTPVPPAPVVPKPSASVPVENPSEV